MNADLKAAAQQAFNLLDRLPINEGYHDETVEVLDALRAGLAAQAPAEGDGTDWKAIARVQSAKLAVALDEPGARERLEAVMRAAIRLYQAQRFGSIKIEHVRDSKLFNPDLAEPNVQPKGTAASVPEWKREARQAAEGKQAYYRDMMRQAREAREDAQAPAPVAGLVRRGFLLQWPTANGRRPVWSDTDAAAKAIGCPVEALFALDAQAPAVGAPTGYVLLPVEPTPEMWAAARAVPEPVKPYPPHYALIWDAMLKAAPKPPVQGSQS